MAAVPGEPASGAVLLYRGDYRDDVENLEFLYNRLKILTDDGRRYSKVAVSIPEHCTVQDLAARATNQAGIAELETPHLTSTDNRHWDAREQTFTFVHSDPGTIIEYKYRLVCDRDRDAPAWLLQGDLYIVKESFRLRRGSGARGPGSKNNSTELSYVFSNLPSGIAPRETSDGVELEMVDVPAFKSEPYMPPKANFIPKVDFFYGGSDIASPELFWKEHGKHWYAEQQRFIGDPAQLRTTAAEIVGSETDSERKLRKLYARVQQIRNSSYEDMAPQNEPAANALTVITRGYGKANEITDLFAGLSRALGFETEVLRASDRRTQVFDQKLLTTAQLSSEIIRVRLNDKEIFLDPGTKFCPFGLVAWSKTSMPALKLDAEGGTFMLVPTATADKSVVRRTAEAALSGDGSLQGTVTLEFNGNEALEQRLSTPSDDQARREELQRELSNRLPQNAVLKLREIHGWNDSEAPLIARFSVEVPGFARVSNLRLHVPANLFRSTQPESLQSPVRKYPVYFPYTFEEIDRFSLQLPGDLSVETMPNGQDIRQPSTRMVTTRALNQTTLVTTRALVVNSIYFPTEQYPELRSFLSKVQQADAEQVVVTKEKQ